MGLSLCAAAAALIVGIGMFSNVLENAKRNEAKNEIQVEPANGTMESERMENSEMDGQFYNCQRVAKREMFGKPRPPVAQ